MSFLEMFTPDHLALFQSASSTLELSKGQYLIRRGEPGGDIYLLEAGTLEVIDTRSTPEVIIAVLSEGAVVGEMAFIDDAPRSADVRATADIRVRRWARDDLRALLGRNPPFAASFFEAIARLASERSRSFTSTAVTGGINPQTSGAIGLARVQEEATAVSLRAKERLLSAETRLRQDPEDRLARQDARLALDDMLEDVRELVLSHNEPEAANEGARILARELHPYLVRSALAERCIRRASGSAGTAEILAHVLVDSPGGEGQLGELLDRWLLDLPTLQALRGMQQPLVTALKERLPTDQQRAVLLVNAGTGSLVASLFLALARHPTRITVLDQSRDALAFLDAGVTHRPRTVDLVTVQENLAGFAMGTRHMRLAPQDAVVLHGLLEYMPDRIAVSLLKVAARAVRPGGSVVLSCLGPSRDDPLLDRLLNWPTVRRTPDAMRVLFKAAGLVPTWSPDLTEPAQVYATTPLAKEPGSGPPESTVANGDSQE